MNIGRPRTSRGLRQITEGLGALDAEVFEAVANARSPLLDTTMPALGRAADSCQLGAQCGRQHRGSQCAAADQNEPHARGAVAHDRADHLPRWPRPVQPLQVIKNKHDLGVGGRIDKQAGGLGSVGFGRDYGR